MKCRGQILDRLNELEKYLQFYEVDLFISQKHYIALSPSLQMIFFRLSGLKAGMEFHQCTTRHIARFPNTPLIYKMADFLVALSNTFKTYLKNSGIRSYYIPHPITIDGAENFHGRNPKNCSNTILYVGRIAKATDKNTFAILPILNEVVKVIPNVKLKIVGEIFHEEVFQQMKKFIAENRLESNVEFCGYHKDVGKFYEKADLILNTSPSEGFPMFVVESKFYELPMVLYELPDVETLRDGKGYIAVPQGDFRAAARAIVKILTDTEFRCKMSAEARESLQKFLDYDIAGAWKKIFDDLENNVPVPLHNLNAEKIQTFLLKEIWQTKSQVQFLTAQIQKLQAKN